MNIGQELNPLFSKAIKGGREEVYSEEHAELYSARGGDWEEMNF
jgi:hypothetical protein